MSLKAHNKGSSVADVLQKLTIKVPLWQMFPKAHNKGSSVADVLQSSQ